MKLVNYAVIAVAIFLGMLFLSIDTQVQATTTLFANYSQKRVLPQAAMHRQVAPPTYLYDWDPNGSICGTTGPSPNIVAMDVDPGPGGTTLQIEVMKCTENAFGQGGNVYVDISNRNGVLRTLGPYPYEAGIEKIKIDDVDPAALGHYGFNLIQARVLSADQPSIPKHTGHAMTWEIYDTPADVQTDLTYEPQPTTAQCGDIVKLQLVPRGNVIQAKIGKCNNTPFAGAGHFYILVDGVPHWGPFTYANGVQSIEHTFDPADFGLAVAWHSYSAAIYSNGPQPLARISGEVQAIGREPTPTPIPTLHPTITPLPALGPAEENFALGKNATASAGTEPGRVTDGDTSTTWNAGGVAPQWVEIDLGEEIAITRVQMLMNQLPEGPGTHQVWGKGNSGDYRLLAEISAYTRTREWIGHLFTSPASGIRYVKVETVKHSSWVAWYEIEVYRNKPSTPLPPLGEVEIAIDDHAATVGEEVIVPVLVNIAGGQVGAATVQIDYDPNLLLAISCIPDPSNRFDGKLCNVNGASFDNRTDMVRFSVASVVGVTSQLTLANVTFRIIDGASSTASLNIVVNSLGDPTSRTISPVITDGQIQITAGPQNTSIPPTSVPSSSATPTSVKPTPVTTLQATPTTIETSPPAPATPSATATPANTPVPQPSPEVAITNGSASGAPGSDFFIAGEGFSAGARVTIEVDGVRLATLDAESNGNFTLILETPTDISAGTHDVVIYSGNEIATTEFTISATASVQELTGQVSSPNQVSIPSSANENNELYLPLVQR